MRRSLATTALAISMLSLVGCAAPASDDESLPAVDAPGAAAEVPPSAPADAPPSDGPAGAVNGEAPSGTAAKVPTSAPAQCPGLGKTAAVRLLSNLGRADVPIKPALLSVSNLGSGFARTSPVQFGSQIAVGTVAYEASIGSATGTGSNFGGTTHQARTNLTASSFHGIVPSDLLTTTYSLITNGDPYVYAWAKAAVPAPHSLTFYALQRQTVGNAGLLNAHRGTNWSSTTFDEYVDSASYTRYAAFSFTIEFDSDCQRDTYVSRAGDNTVDALLPASDTKSLGRYLVDSGARLRMLGIALGPSDQMTAAMTPAPGSSCSATDLAACHAMVINASAVVSNVGKVSTPTTFSSAASGNGGWYIDSFRARTKGLLQP